MIASPSLSAKLHFLRSAGACPGWPHASESVETHMSWVFFAGDRVLKLKKPVRFPFLDFSTLAQREFYCREEVRLNTRLAPDVYLGLLALQTSPAGWALVPDGSAPGRGTTVDWLVEMRRLPAGRMLSTLLVDGTTTSTHIDALVDVLAGFYRGAVPATLTPAAYVERFERELAIHRDVLLQPQFDLCDAAGALDAFERAWGAHAHAVRARAETAHVVQGHGDLRPEHVCLLDPPVVIDCLEFNASLREVDPFDEIAFLGLECAIAGAPWIGPPLTAGLARALGDTPAPPLMALYTAQRALLRARLSMAHLLDPVVRTPHRWPAQARRYIEHALQALDGI